jgi:hypothetical protein
MDPSPQADDDELVKVFHELVVVLGGHSLRSALLRESVS